MKKYASFFTYMYAEKKSCEFLATIYTRKNKTVKNQRIVRQFSVAKFSNTWWDLLYKNHIETTLLTFRQPQL